jgi:hypothetical protein
MDLFQWEGNFERVLQPQLAQSILQQQLKINAVPLASVRLKDPEGLKGSDFSKCETGGWEGGERIRAWVSFRDFYSPSFLCFAHLAPTFPGLTLRDVVTMGAEDSTKAMEAVIIFRAELDRVTE